MTPEAFTFKLTVPRDPALGAIVADVAAHAVTYAEMDTAEGAAFVRNVAAASAAELRAEGPTHCLIVITCAGGELRLTIGNQTLSQKLSA